ARSAGDHDAMIEALLVNVRTSVDAARECDVERIELLEYALGLPSIDAGRRARVLGALAVELLFLGVTARRRAVLDEARTLADGVDEPLVRIDVSASHFWARSRASWSADEFDDDRARARAALDRAAELADPLGLAILQGQAAAYAVLAGDGADLRRQEAALAVTSDGGRHQVARRAQLLVARTVATLEGRMAEADELSIEGRDLRRKTGLVEAERLRTMELAAIRREEGRLEEMLPAVADQAAGQAPAGVATATLAFVMAETGRDADAAILLHEAGDGGFCDIPDDAQWPVAVGLWAEVAARVGDLGAATALHDLVLPGSGRSMSGEGMELGPAARLVGMLGQLVGRPEEADPFFADAISFATALGSPVWVARSALDWAETWLRRDEPDQAARLIDAADVAMAGLDLPALQAQSADLRSRLAR
ncbi:MAG: hypothetical protein ACRDY1_14305, partial [Acidimicrobiales bacterium]